MNADKLALLPTGLTYDDVLLVPQFSDIKSRRDVSTKSRLSRNITINIPIVSSNMDTVTEGAMATAMARAGGIGIIHRFCSVEQQVKMVLRVKRAMSHKVADPVTLPITASRDEVLEALAARGVRDGGISSVMIIDKERRLIGLITKYDLELTKASPQWRITDVMVPQERLITTKDPNITLEAAAEIMIKKRVTELPIVDDNFKLIALCTAGDVKKLTGAITNATLDAKGQLRVGAAIGVKSGDMERAIALVEAGADCLVVDIAHGHTTICAEMVRLLKSHSVTRNVDIIAGNVATGEGAKYLIDAGADSIKLGVGPGSICVTRIVAGSGYPQLSAIADAFAVCKKHGVPIIADGGVRTSGDIAKAIAAGASTVMLGSQLAGCTESPGFVTMRSGRRVKIVAGMAGQRANAAKAVREKTGNEKNVYSDNFTPEGVEGVVPYRGRVISTLAQFVGGLRSGMTYSGSRTIEEMQQKAKFVRMTGAGLKESGAHDISKL